MLVFLLLLIGFLLSAFLPGGPPDMGMGTPGGMVTPGSMTGDEQSPQIYVDRGNYQVGMTPLYFHDPDRPFDAWNAEHGSEGYQATLKAVNDAGEKQIVAAHMWYPVRQDATGRLADYADFAQSESPVFRQAYQQAGAFFAFNLTNAAGQSAMEIVSANPAIIQGLSAAMSERLVDSLYQPAIAPGRFPVIIAAHGLGGNSAMWVKLAEYLASNGYIVVAPSFISDSGLPNVFDSPDSQYAQSAGADAVNAAYRTILGEDKVIPSFFRYFFGQEPPPEVGESRLPAQLELTAVPGGGQRVGELMAGLFTQRVGDVSTIIDGLESLNRSAADCEAQYAARGQANHGAQVCGMFANAMDLDHIGILGHSLGSMTAQFAVAKDPRLAAAVGYNNGPPRYWEPEGIFGDGLAADGQPAGNPNPVMQIHGSEDIFVQGVFRDIMWNVLAAAGGDPEEIWTLAPERALPTDENPQPIARNAYTRATGDKVIISVKDVSHGTLVDDFFAIASPDNPITVNGADYWNAPMPTPRKSVGEDVFDRDFVGEPYTPLNWGTVNGVDVYLPVFLRNYYTINWFDYYLKGDRSALRFLENPVADLGIIDLRSSVNAP